MRLLLTALATGLLAAVLFALSMAVEAYGGKAVVTAVLFFIFGAIVYQLLEDF
jgi:hypothetical protein